MSFDEVILVGAAIKRECAVKVFARSTSSARRVEGSWCVAALSFVVGVSIMLGCSDEPKPPTLARSTRADSTEPLDIYVGPTLMRIPWNMLSHSPDQGRAFVGPGPYKADAVYLGVVWPDMAGQKIGRPGGQNTLFVEVRGFRDRTPSPAEWRKKATIERLSLLDGPFVDEALGMREWRAKSGGPPLVFGLKESNHRAPYGIEPLVFCSYAGTKQIYSCNGGGVIDTNLGYSYVFSPTVFPEWPAIDIAVRKLIESMMVKGE